MDINQQEPSLVILLESARLGQRQREAIAGVVGAIADRAVHREEDGGLGIIDMRS